MNDNKYPPINSYSFFKHNQWDIFYAVYPHACYQICIGLRTNIQVEREFIKQRISINVLHEVSEEVYNCARKVVETLNWLENV